MRALKIAAAILVVVLVIGGAAFWALSRTPVATAYHDPVDARTIETNDHIRFRLLLAGLPDVAVITTEDRVTVGYVLPDESNFTSDQWQVIVLGFASAAAPEGATVLAEQYANGTLTVSWSALASDAIAFIEGKLAAEEWAGRLTIVEGEASSSTE